MPNYRMTIDLLDLYIDLARYDLREYRLPFSLYILEADNPDDACSILLRRIMNAIMQKDPSMETRILCRKLRRFMRIDRVECL